ncbi:rano class II histocompatibility antigen, A beta chain isoform X4 [Oryzias latipes]|uniref:rano class II histocompatibility antigen, A beta chain isoform X4 n=1 Tax=Oryzias latipes TaxID=8090 RepID=UPI0009D9EB72|nr:rano class II histocompatibility antigen, A beta chain isoform X4 [Oryzias latipes]
MDRFLLFLGCLLPSVADYSKDQHGYFMFSDFFCYIPSRNPKEVQYLIDWYFNMELTMQYNSSVGGWTGFTPAGLITAAKFNADKYDVVQRILERELVCQRSVEMVYNGTEEAKVEPNVSLQTVEDNDSTLECSALDFYPKHIRLTWFSNGQEVTEGVTFSDVLPNGDWTYQAHTYLTLTPGKQDHISCMVQHTSLKEPKIYNWESSKNHTENYIIGGVCALLLGAVFLCGGLIHYKLRRRSF